MSNDRVVVVGAGIFGVVTALELQQRGHRVTLVDKGTVPNPLASSTDISKVVRVEYGSDLEYMTLAETARQGWLRWNERWREEGVGDLYHETGVLMLTREPMRSGGFEYESWRALQEYADPPERMSKQAIGERFPAWRTGNHVDGFFHHRGGYAESGRVVDALSDRARREGIQLRENVRVEELQVKDGRALGVRSDDGELFAAEAVVLAAGAWTSRLVPALAPLIEVTGQPVFHLRPTEPSLFAANRFPVFAADVSHTGFYGFPISLNGVVKIANHGAGTRIDPRAERRVPPKAESELRSFLTETFPDLATADIVHKRLCLYSDTLDGDFFIANHPDIEGLTIAGGGSGHAFKFAPVLGPIIADVVEGAEAPTDRFRWRTEARSAPGQETARNPRSPSQH